MYFHVVLLTVWYSLFWDKKLLEIHHQNSGLTNTIFRIFRLTKYCNKQYYVLIHKNLNNHFKFKKKKFIVLDDGVDTKRFQATKKKIKLIIHVFILVVFIKEKE